MFPFSLLGGLGPTSLDWRRVHDIVCGLSVSRCAEHWPGLVQRETHGQILVWNANICLNDQRYAHVVAATIKPVGPIFSHSQTCLNVIVKGHLISTCYV